MRRTHGRRSWLGSLALAAGVAALGGCGDESQEQQLAEASRTLQVAREEVAQARDEVEVRRQKVQEAEAELAEAQRALRHVEEKLRSAESQVDLKATDAALFRAVQKRLLDDDALGDVAIDADVAKGVVTLRGTVPNRETVQRAVEIAESVPGVVKVEDRITVTSEKLEAAGEDL